MTKVMLAIDGGPPSVDSAPFQWPFASEAIRNAVSEAMSDGSWGQYDGRWTRDLIELLKINFQSEEAMLCSSGTIAVELALRGAGVQAESEVILAGYDFPGNFRAIEAIGARPVLVDVVPNGWVLSAEQLSEALTPQTSAVIVSHLHGQIADLEQIQSVLRDHNLDTEQQVMLIEDACQVPGGKILGRPLGSFCDVAALSFGGSKLLSAGRGGAILTNRSDILQRAKIFAHRGNDAFPMCQLQAATLCPQFDTLPEMTEVRHRNATQLIESTSSLDELVGLQQIVDGATPAYYKVPWLLKDRTPGWSRSELVSALKAEGLPIGEGFRGFLRRSPRRCRKTGTLVNCQIASQQTIVLHHPVLLEPEETLQLIATAIHKVVTNSR
ncbi:DegT/DnrJ/EryC1/StrS aminotransferase family protein [bacterium]|nr:DegT/DnrJ/EryC1/StrS aminotransferase family protein [bacterium]